MFRFHKATGFRRFYCTFGTVTGKMPGVEAIYRQLRVAIEGSGTSRYQLAAQTGVSESQLAQFMIGKKGLSVEAIERLAEALDLQIVIRPRTRKGGGRPRGNP